MNKNDKADIMNAVKELKDQMDEIQHDVDTIKKEVTATQPSKKFKVSKTETDKDNNLVTVYHNDKARQVGLTVKERGSVKTTEMASILRNNSVDCSRPTVINIMRRYAEQFDQFKLLEPKKEVRSSLHLRYKS